jgi:hypothetical protein
VAARKLQDLESADACSAHLFKAESCQDRPSAGAAERRAYSSNESARSKNASGIVSPIAFAVLRLIASSNSRCPPEVINASIRPVLSACRSLAGLNPQGTVPYRA